MDRLDAMRLFVRVAELGSFSAVAKQTAVARSVVTRQVAALEAHLGVKLLARSTRRISLTAGGAAYLEKCRVILNLVDVAEPWLATGKLVAVLSEFERPELGIYALLPGNRHVPHRLRVLIDYLAERMRTR